MAALRACSVNSVTSGCNRSARPTPPRSRCALVVRASQASTRREVLLAAGAASLPLLLAATPAQAFLGIGEGKAREEAYNSDTSAILGKVNSVLALDKDDPSKEDSVIALRKDINGWVAKYRRDEKFSGRPSYGNTYSALNAIAGHYNSFGPTAPIPKKRMERLSKELGDAELLLARNR